MHMWAIPGDSLLLHSGLENVKLLFYEYLSCYCINTCSLLLPNKYMELNKTEAIAGVPTLDLTLYIIILQHTSINKQYKPRKK